MLKYLTVVNEASFREYVLQVLESLNILNLFSSEISIRTLAESITRNAFEGHYLKYYITLLLLNILQALQT